MKYTSDGTVWRDEKNQVSGESIFIKYADSYQHYCETGLSAPNYKFVTVNYLNLFHSYNDEIAVSGLMNEDVLLQWCHMGTIHREIGPASIVLEGI